MLGNSFLNFLREEDGKADKMKVLGISALIGSSVLAQVMFTGVAHAIDCPNTCVNPGNCAFFPGCGESDCGLQKSTCWVP